MASNQHTDEILIAAYYRARGLKQEEIARILDKSMATVTRRLREAQETGLLQEKVVLNATSDELRSIYTHVSNRELGQALEQHFGRRTLQQVIVVPTCDPALTSGRELTSDEIRDFVGKSAALHISCLVDATEGKQLVGVSFGRTVRLTAEAARRSTDSVRTDTNLQFIPLTGGLSALSGQLESSLSEAIDYLQDAFRLSASENALAFAQAFGAKLSGQLHLPTPAFCPRGFLEQGGTLDQAWQFVTSIREYQLIFGSTTEGERDPSALVAQLSAAVTSVGGPPGGSGKEPGWLGMEGPLLEVELDALIDEGAVGDVCGHFITQDKVSDFPPDSVMHQVNKRIFGPRPDDFRRCARRALTDGTPGVIMIAHSSDKAPAVLSAIRNECVSVLVVDEALAQAVVALEPGLEV